MATEGCIYWLGALTAMYLTAGFLQFIFLYLRPSSLLSYRQKRESWALVTGATDGIGFCLAQELCDRGFNVILHGRNPSKLERVKASLTHAFPSARIRVFVWDASLPISSSSLQRLLAGMQDIHLSVLVNNVGGTSAVFPDLKPLKDHTHDEADAMLNLNCRFATQLTRAILPLLQRNQPGLVINIGSAASMGIPYLTVYSGAKAFLMSWGKALQIELNAEGHDISVMGVVVGNAQSAANRSDATLFTPTSLVMAKAILDRVGCGKSIVVAYLPHALQIYPLGWLPEVVVQRILTNAAKAHPNGQDSKHQ
ncbi:hypothetical protein MMC07_007110 [Pseudocyphellaria aurata]|nr:hypothetical protein [Pseudocyphellaria aurata]